MTCHLGRADDSGLKGTCDDLVAGGRRAAGVKQGFEDGPLTCWIEVVPVAHPVAQQDRGLDAWTNGRQRQLRVPPAGVGGCELGRSRRADLAAAAGGAFDQDNLPGQPSAVGEYGELARPPHSTHRVVRAVVYRAAGFTYRRQVVQVVRFVADPRLRCPAGQAR